MIFGAGIFALPFAVSRAGIFWGAFYFILALLLMIFLHLWYGEAAYYTKGKHRFTGYVEMLLGGKAKWFAFLITLFLSYGSLLVYGLLGGIFLLNIFGGSLFFWSLLIFLTGGILIFMSFEKIAVINFYLSIALLGIVVYLFIAAVPHIKIANFLSAGSGPTGAFDWFLPYGVWLFSLAGFAVLPEVRDIISGSSFRDFKKVILISILLCGILYSFFVFAVVGVNGKNTTEDALGGLRAVLGAPAFLIGSLLGFLAIFTSFIALAVDLKNIFRYDFRFSSTLAWFSVFLPPIILFLLGATNFIEILGILGSVGLGLTGIFIVLMARRLAERRNDKKFLMLSWFVGALIALGIIAAVISELKSFF